MDITFGSTIKSFYIFVDREFKSYDTSIAFFILLDPTPPLPAPLLCSHLFLQVSQA